MRSEPELRESEQRLQAILAATLDAFVTMDHAGVITGWSGQAEPMFGWSASEAIGRTLGETIVPAHSREAHRKGLARFLETGEGPIIGRRIEVAAIRRSGEEFPVELTVVPVRLSDAWLFTAFIRDITQRKLAEARLAAQHAVTRILADSETVERAAPAVLETLCQGLGWELGEMWEVDSEASVLRNIGAWHAPSAAVAEFETASRTFALGPGEGLPGKVWATGESVWTPDFAVAPSMPRRAEAERGDLHASFGTPIHNGATVVGVLQFFSRQIRTPDPELLAMMTNLGSQIGQHIERSRAEKRIRASEHRYRQLMELAVDAILIADHDGRIVDANTAAFDLTGYDRSELIGLNIADTYAIDEQAAGKDRVSNVRRGEALRVERRLRRKDGSSVEVEITAKLLPNGLMQGMVRDVTGRKLLEEQLRRSQKMEAVGQLAGGIAHDFNNLLTAILGYVDLVQRSMAQDDPRLADLLEIRGAANRAADLTRQLLAFGRRQVLKPRHVNLSRLVADIERLLRRLIGENIDVVTVADPELGNVLADPSQLEQVIVNLVVNARDAMSRGGRLTIETRNVTLDQEYSLRHGSVPGAYVLLAVTDNGAGMDQATLARIFEPFFTTKGPGQGTGLGLSTVYGIVKQSGGYIWVYSEPEQGSSFKIYLPRDYGPGEAIPEPTAPAEVKGGSETILLVEDEASVRGLGQRVLAEWGYRLLVAGSGADALKLAEDHDGPIDLLLTDVVMPGMSGRELAELTVAIRPGTRVLYMTGYTEDTVVRHGLLTADLAFLEKPFHPDQLLARIREVLR